MTQLRTMSTDFMEAYNRYPELFKRVSIIQYPTDMIAFNEEKDRVTIIAPKDLFLRSANLRGTQNKVEMQSKIGNY